MKKRIIKTTLVLTAVHFLLMFGSVVIAYGVGMEKFDNPDYQPSGVEGATSQLAGVLVQPGISIWTPWMSKNVPDALEWVLVVANSLLWGFVIALLINSPALLKRKKTDSNEVTRF